MEDRHPHINKHLSTPVVFPGRRYFSIKHVSLAVSALLLCTVLWPQRKPICQHVEAAFSPHHVISLEFQCLFFTQIAIFSPPPPHFPQTSKGNWYRTGTALDTFGGSQRRKNQLTNSRCLSKLCAYLAIYKLLNLSGRSAEQAWWSLQQARPESDNAGVNCA